MWKGEEGTGGLWEADGDDIYYDKGNVGIGTNDPKALVDAEGASVGYRFNDGTNSASFKVSQSDDKIMISQAGSASATAGLAFATGTGAFGAERMTIGANGNVGIGTDNLTSSLTINQESISQSSRVQTTNGTQELFSGVWAGLSRIESLGSQFNIGTADDNSLVLRTKNADRMTIDASGDVTLAHPAGLYGRRTSGDLALKLIGYVPGTDNVELVTSNEWLLKNGSGNTLLKVNANDGRVDITGSLYVNGTPKIGYQELITTLVTLRNATQDETTLEGLRDSIGNAIGGLIEKFEQEIATMPAEDSE
jgi:hypothetical protein